MSALRGALTVLLGKQLKVWLGAGLLALISAVNSASAQTVDVLNNNVTSVSGVGFNLLNLGSATASGFQSSSTLTNQTGGGLPTPTGTEITKIAFAGSSSAKSGVYAYGVSGIAASPISNSSNLKYLVAEGASQSVGTVTVSYSVPQYALQILWGTIGSGDTLTFCGNASCTATNQLSFTGSDLLNKQKPAGYATVNYTGQTAASNYNNAITIKGLPGFSTIRLSDHNNNPAFEFLLGQPVPEPGSLTALGMGVAGLAVARRRAKKPV